MLSVIVSVIVVSVVEIELNSIGTTVSLLSPESSLRVARESYEIFSGLQRRLIQQIRPQGKARLQLSTFFALSTRVTNIFMKSFYLV